MKPLENQGLKAVFRGQKDGLRGLVTPFGKMGGVAGSDEEAPETAENETETGQKRHGIRSAEGLQDRRRNREKSRGYRGDPRGRSSSEIEERASKVDVEDQTHSSPS